MDSGVGGFLRTEQRKPSVINTGDFDLPEPTSPRFYCGMKFGISYTYISITQIGKTIGFW
jgi:hypothetical protein